MSSNQCQSFDKEIKIYKKLKIELIVLEPVRFLPDPLRPCLHVCFGGFLGLSPLLNMRWRAVRILISRLWSSLVTRLVPYSDSVSLVDNFLPIYYVGSIAVFSTHSSSSPITLLSFRVLVQVVLGLDHLCHRYT